MKAAVEAAIAEIRAGLPGNQLDLMPDADGGAFVIVAGLQIGDQFAPSTSWVGFQITWSCPDADTYPHFIEADVRYTGTGPAPNQYPEGNLPTGMTRGAVMPGFNRAAVQVSRRSNRRNVETDTPLQKLIRIQAFLRSR